MTDVLADDDQPEQTSALLHFLGRRPLVHQRLDERLKKNRSIEHQVPRDLVAPWAFVWLEPGGHVCTLNSERISSATLARTEVMRV